MPPLPWNLLTFCSKVDRFWTETDLLLAPKTSAFAAIAFAFLGNASKEKVTAKSTATSTPISIFQG